MANFQTALHFVLQNEGGWSDAEGDSGGETWCGISRNNFPNWPGWPIIDAAKADRDFPHCLWAIAPLQKKVDDFYTTTFWQPIQGDRITNQDVATRLMDACVNCGLHEGVVLMQRALKIPEDGILGPETLSHINEVNPLSAFRAERAIFYAEVYGRNPSRYAPFLSSWMHRATA
jgi:lysozyme family protein